MTGSVQRFFITVCLGLLIGLAMPGRVSFGANHQAEAQAENLLDSSDPAQRQRGMELLEQAIAQGNLTAVHKLAMALDERSGAGDLERARGLLARYREAFFAAYRGDGAELASYLRAIAFVSSSSGLSQEALEASQKAREYVVALGKYGLWVAQLDMEIGNYLEDLGRHEEALASMSKALPVIEKGHGKDHPRTAAVRQNMANVYESMSEYGKALSEYEAALRVHVKTEGRNSLSVAQLYDNIGGLLERLGRGREALAYFEKATPIFAATVGPDHPLMGRHLADMATIFSSLKRYPEALDNFNRAIPLLTAGFGENNKFVAAVQFNRANVMGQLGRNGEALKAYEAAKDIDRAVSGEGSPFVAMVNVEMAGSLVDLGRSGEGLALYNEALPVYRRTLGENNLRVGMIYNAIGVANTNLQNYEAAIAAYRSALAVNTALFGPSHPEVADVLSNLSRALAETGADGEAIALLTRALAIYAVDPAGNLDPLRKSYLGLANRLKLMNARRAATVFAKLAVNAHQDLRLRNAELPPALEQSLARSMKPAYDLLVEQQIADGAFSEAQFAGSLIKSAELVAFSRGKASEEQAAGARARLTRSEAAFLAELTKALAPTTRAAAELRKLFDKRRVSKLSTREQARFSKLEAGFEQSAGVAAAAARALFSSLESERRSMQQDVLSKGVAQASRVQKTLASLGSGVVLYQAIALDDRLHLFVSAAGRETVHREVAIARPELARKVYEAVSAVEQRDDRAASLLEQLHAILIGPVAADLTALKPSVLMLDLAGFLRYVPYAALNSGGRYLIEDYALALYTPAVPTRFAETDRTAASGAGFGVSRALSGFAPLPGAGLELESIFTGTDRIGPLNGTAYIDGDFNPASIKRALRGKPQFIHIASHFKFEPGNETRSFLLLGTGGALTLADLRADRNISFAGVDLLTLSACETARGGGSEGEEIESFGALAQAKGASAVMATLWQIADQSTARLMIDFYSGLISGRLDKARALQRAQVAMLRGIPAEAVALRGSRGVTAPDEDGEAFRSSSTAHPFYWSAFILMGNWK